MTLPAIRPSQYALETAVNHAAVIRRYVHVQSASLICACVDAGLPLELAELAAGVLASVVNDLIVVSALPRNSFERTKRKQRILAAAVEPIASALKIAVACSPLNGRAAVEHWDVVCEKYEIGKLAWLLSVPTEAAHKYSKKVEKRT